MKTWGSVPNNMRPLEALEYCIANNILTRDNMMQCSCTTFGPDGTGYFKYQRLTVKEIVDRKAILYWFDGFSVIWTDVIHHTGLNGGDRPFDDHPQEVKNIVYRKFADWRRFTGTRAEVRAITSR